MYSEEQAISEEHRPNISWGAIFAGAFVAFVVNVGLISFGSGIGFTSFDPAAGDSLGQGSMISAAIFALVAGVASLFAGGFVSARMAGFRQRSVAGLHGLCSWAVVSTAVIVMMGMGLSNMAGAALGFVGDGVKGLASAGVQAASNIQINADPKALVGEAKEVLRDTRKPELRPENLENTANRVPREAAEAQANQGGNAGSQVVQREGQEVANAIDREAVTSVIARRTGLSEEEAASLLGQSEEKAKQVWGNLQARAKAAGTAAAEQATDVMAYASWFTFATLLIGAIAGYLGGVAGGPEGFTARRQTVVVRKPNRKTTLDQPLGV